MLPLNKLREITLSSNIREVSLRACRCVRMIRLFKRSALTLLCRVARQFQGNWTVNTASRRDWTPWPIRQELISICYHWLTDVACHGEILTSNFIMNGVIIILILNWWYFLTGDMPIRHDFVGRQSNKRVKGGWWCPRTWTPAAVKFYLKISDRDHIIVMTGTVLFRDGSAGMLGCWVKWAMCGGLDRTPWRLRYRAKNSAGSRFPLCEIITQLNWWRSSGVLYFSLTSF